MSAIQRLEGLERFVRQIPLPDRSVINLTNCVFSGDLRQAAKTALYISTGNGAAVQGLGFEVVGLEKLSELEKGRLSIDCEQTSSPDEPTINRLHRAAIHTKLEMGPALENETENQCLVRYLKEQAEPGDIVLVSCGGKAQKFESELFENLYRRVSIREAGESICPFTHALIVDSEGNLLHINRKGVNAGSWERRFIERKVFDGVALLRVNVPKNDRMQLAQEATCFAHGKKFNSWWALIKGPLTQIASRFGVHLADTSATNNKAVCVDFVTEPAKKLANNGVAIHPDLRTAMTPRDIMVSRGVSLIAAGSFKRE